MNPDSWLAQLKKAGVQAPGKPTAPAEVAWDEEPAPEPKGSEPYKDLLWVWDGYWRLSNKRPQGMNGPLRIPISEIEALARYKSWPYAKRQDFLYFVDLMDEAFMAYVARRQAEEERKRQTSNDKPQPSSRRRR